MADHDNDESDDASRPDPAGGLPNRDRDNATDSSGKPAQTDQPDPAGKRPLQEVIDDSIGSAAGGPGA